jgi:hypothetical protein
MSLELTEEQRRAVEEHPEEPVRLVDPASQKIFVLVSAEIYDRIKDLLEDIEDRAGKKAWLDSATRARRKWVQENPY